MENEPTDSELLDWLTQERCNLTCWDVVERDDPTMGNGWTVHGAGNGGGDINDPVGHTAREAIVWAMKLHRLGKFKTRTDELREEIEI